MGEIRSAGSDSFLLIFDAVHPSRFILEIHCSETIEFPCLGRIPFLEPRLCQIVVVPAVGGIDIHGTLESGDGLIDLAAFEEHPGLLREP